MRILTGLQPSGRLHVGNYFGAMKPAIDAQDEGDGYYFIADYHAMTTTHEASALRENVRGVAIDFLACGFDPSKAVFFKQSAVPAVNELAWILSTVCPMGLLERCHSYKDKIAKGFSANHALFAYPALMAADILLYDSNVVPVGEDQKQHLEVTRDLVGKINERYGDDTLVMPEARIRSATAKVPGLDGEKMSKSYNNTLPIFGEEKPVRKLIMKIQTDSAQVEDSKPTENSIILALYKLFASESDYVQMVAPMGFSSQRHRQGPGSRWRKDEQELQQHSPHLRRGETGSEAHHENSDRFRSGRRFKAHRKFYYSCPLQTLRQRKRLRPNGHRPRKWRLRIRRLQKAPRRCLLGLLRADAPQADRTGC